MKAAPLPNNEIERLSTLYEYNILDTLPETDFDDITRIASEICHTPISLVSIIDAKRQWFKSKQGLDLDETPREYSFCAHAILHPDEVFIVPNSAKDERFNNNPLVTGKPNIVFYAGVPLVTDNGYPLGTLCVVDDKPKTLTPGQVETLKALADQIVAMLALRKKNHELCMREKELMRMNEDLEKFAHTVAHDMKSPCNNIIAITDILAEEHATQIDEEGLELLGHLKNVSFTMKQLIDNILHDARTAFNLSTDKEAFTFSGLMDELKPLLQLPAKFAINYTKDDSKMYAAKTALIQILLNLCTNAIKYNDKEHGIISIAYSQDERHYYFTVSDNGMGIPSSSFRDIFELFQTLGYKDRYRDEGHGIGLSTVKNLVEKLGGKITVESEVGIGSTFRFSIKK